MDGSVSDEQAHAWLQDIADAGWVSLHYESPALGSVGKGEIGGGGYVRFKMSFSQPANRAIWSLADAKFTGLTQNRLTHFGIWSSQYLGMIRAYGPLPEAAVIVNGWGYILHEGDLAVSIG